jgi:hypothetical protein
MMYPMMRLIVVVHHHVGHDMIDVYSSDATNFHSAGLVELRVMFQSKSVLMLQFFWQCVGN